MGWITEPKATGAITSAAGYGPYAVVPFGEDEPIPYFFAEYQDAKRKLEAFEEDGVRAALYVVDAIT